jgi:hypothetical protein
VVNVMVAFGEVFPEGVGIAISEAKRLGVRK